MSQRWVFRRDLEASVLYQDDAPAGYISIINYGTPWGGFYVAYTLDGEQLGEFQELPDARRRLEEYATAAGKVVKL